MNDVLMRAVVEAAMFVGLSGDDVIQPDAAVAFLEQLASTLKDLTSDDRREFIHFVERMETEERAAKRTERAEFLTSLCSDLGLM